MKVQKSIYVEKTLWDLAIAKGINISGELGAYLEYLVNSKSTEIMIYELEHRIAILKNMEKFHESDESHFLKIHALLKVRYENFMTHAKTSETKYIQITKRLMKINNYHGDPEKIYRKSIEKHQKETGRL